MWFTFVSPILSIFCYMTYFWVKIIVYSNTSVYLWYFCYYTQIGHIFFTNKVCKKVRYQNTLSPVNRRFVINHIAQWKIWDLLYKISILFTCSLVSFFCYFSFKLTAPNHNSKNDNSCWTSKWITFYLFQVVS